MTWHNIADALLVLAVFWMGYLFGLMDGRERDA